MRRKPWVRTVAIAVVVAIVLSAVAGALVALVA
jgi:hypothetical protein